MGTVGAGLIPMPRIDHELLGLDKKARRKFEDQVKRIWATWSQGAPCDIENVHKFAALQQMVFTSAWENGDVFVMRRHELRPRDLLSLKIQPIEADRCSTPDSRLTDPLLFEGVELSASGERVAYHFSEDHPGEMLRYRAPVKTWKRVPAHDALGEPLVLHITCASAIARIGAARGIPALAPAIKIFKQIDRYTTAEIMAAVVSAMFTVFIKNQQGTGAATGLAQLDPNNPAPEGQHRLDTGAILELLEGQDIVTANPGRPNSQAAPFIAAMLEQVGTCLGIPYEVLVRKFTASYSASRAAIEMAWAAFRIARSMFVDEFAQPVYEWVLTEAVLSGKLDAPGFFDDPLKRMAYCRAEWSGPTAPQVDPLKEAAASKARIDARLSTHERENALINGGDWDETVSQLGDEREELVRLGLDKDLVSEPAPEPAKGTADEDDSDDTTDLETGAQPVPTTGDDQ